MEELESAVGALEQRLERLHGSQLNLVSKFDRLLISSTWCVKALKAIIEAKGLEWQELTDEELAEILGR